MSTHIDVPRLAERVGLRPNALRLLLGIQTRLQQEVRGLETFTEAIALAPKFCEDHSRCGPGFEEAEAEEYREKRAKLFAGEFGELSTLESFPKDLSFLTHGERESLSEHFRELFGERLEAAGMSLKSLLALETVFAETPESIIAGAKTDFTERIREATREALADAESLDEALGVLVPAKETQNYHLRIGRQGQDSWDICRFAQEPADVLRIQKELIGRNLVNEKALLDRFSGLTVEAFSAITFDEALVMLRDLASRDSEDYYDDFYTVALRLAIPHIQGKKQARSWWSLWGARQNVCCRASYRHSPSLPSKFLDKWDSLYLGDTERATGLRQLVSLAKRGPYGTRTSQMAENRILKLFEPRITAAGSKTELTKIKTEFEGLGLRYIIGGLVNTKKNTLERESAIRTARSSDNQDALCGAFHTLKEDDPEIAVEALRRLAQQFPAEVVDVLPESSEVVR